MIALALLVEVRFNILLRHGVGEEGGVLALGFESGFERRALGRVCQCRFGCLCGRLEGGLAGEVLRLLRLLDGVQQIHAQLLLAAVTTLEIQRLRAVELAHHAGKHTM